MAPTNHIAPPREWLLRELRDLRRRCLPVLQSLPVCRPAVHSSLAAMRHTRRCRLAMYAFVTSLRPDASPSAWGRLACVSVARLGLLAEAAPGAAACHRVCLAGALHLLRVVCAALRWVAPVLVCRAVRRGVLGGGGFGPHRCVCPCVRGEGLFAACVLASDTPSRAQPLVCALARASAEDAPSAEGHQGEAEEYPDDDGDGEGDDGEGDDSNVVEVVGEYVPPAAAAAGPAATRPATSGSTAPPGPTAGASTRPVATAAGATAVAGGPDAGCVGGAFVGSGVGVGAGAGAGVGRGGPVSPAAARLPAPALLVCPCPALRPVSAFGPPPAFNAADFEEAPAAPLAHTLSSSSLSLSSSSSACARHPTPPHPLRRLPRRPIALVALYPPVFCLWSVGASHGYACLVDPRRLERGLGQRRRACGGHGLRRR
jgi:hypothetical protein